MTCLRSKIAFLVGERSRKIPTPVLLAQEFAKNEVLPFAAAWDEHHHFPVEIMRKAAGLGFGGLYCSSDVGGTE